MNNAECGILLCLNVDSILGGESVERRVVSPHLHQQIRDSEEVLHQVVQTEQILVGDDALPHGLSAEVVQEAFVAAEEHHVGRAPV